MPKLGMQPIRRAQLIDATLESVHRYGLQKTTLARISAIAEVSTGIIAHYFGGKNELLEAAMRKLLKDLGHGVLSHARNAKTPREHIKAIIKGNFSFEQTHPRAVAIWLAFWAQALHNPELGRLQQVNRKRLHSNLIFWLKQLLPREPAAQTAAGLAALIDGLWLRGAFQPGGINTEHAQSICLDYLQSHCPTKRFKTSESRTQADSARP